VSRSDWSDARFETRAIHAGQDADPATGAVITPIYQTSTFIQEDVGVHKGFEYARTDNPTRSALQEAIASLESGSWGLSYASGLAATQNLLYLLWPGDHILLSNDCYGGTYRLVAKVIANYGIEFSLCDMSDPESVRAGLRPNTRMVWAETPTNPYLKIVDIEAVAAIAHGAGARFVVDNTFASPYLQRPLELGADFVLHSATKYLGGHSDVVNGLIIGNDRDVYDTLKYLQNAAGAVPGPHDCWLVLRGMKTLGIRMERHSANAAAVAEYLQHSSLVDTVYYPGLASHPGHEVARRQMRDFSGMVSFTVNGGYELAREFVASTEVFQLAESLGGVESLVEHPGQMTHASVAGTGAEVADNLIRLSVGIEHVDDLLADLEAAFSRVGASRLAAR
jgi:cystathionine beta-lyase/cystathionine gamma-synthase